MKMNKQHFTFKVETENQKSLILIQISTKYSFFQNL